MSEDILAYLCIFAGLASALVSGVFLSFSDFIMRSLTATPASSGIQAMQQINRKVYRSAFLVLLLGLLPMSVVLAVFATIGLAAPSARWIMAAAFIYLVTVVIVTMVGNVPMNRKLDAMDASADVTSAYWSHYALRWTRLNHIRTAGALASASCFLVAGNSLA